MSSLGYGQTWQSVTRTSGVTYYNTTGRPIVLNINPTAIANTTVSVDGVTTSTILGSSSTTVSSSQIIPVGASYVVTHSGITATELR
jgi:hypothetical protein